MSDTPPSAAHDRSRDRILHGALPWATFRLGAPLALAMVLNVLFNLVDQYLISRLPAAVADPSLDALGICDMVSALATIVSYGLSSATAALISQAKGRGDDDDVARIAWGSMGMVTLLGLAFGVVVVLGADAIVHTVLGAKGAVRLLARDYLRVIVGGSLSVFAMFQVTAVQRALGLSRMTLVTFVTGNILNLVFAVLLVYGPGEAPAVFAWGPPIARALGIPRLEVVGAAWATVLARFVAVAVPLLLLRRELGVAKRGARFIPSRADAKRLLSVAWPTSAQFSLRIGAVLLVIALVHHFFTTETDSTAGTAYSLCLRMETMALFVSMGWGGAAQTFSGMCVGASDGDRARRAGWWLGGYNVATMALLAGLYVTSGREVLRFFSERREILDIGVGYLTVVTPSYALFGLAAVLGNSMVGAGSARLALRMDAVLVLGVQLPLMVLATAVFRVPMTGLWWTVVAVNAISAGAYAWVFHDGTRWLPMSRKSDDAA